MLIVFVILAYFFGVGTDRLIIWDKMRAVKEERAYHIDTIRDQQCMIQRINMERYAEMKERGENPDPEKMVFLNPDFESQFRQHGRAITRISRGDHMQRSQRRPSQAGR